ncbi:MAG: glycoside hydrolase family 2, partial [Clostridia bacterium]|nr:glycoside hydrolase family 2 [Clostridia bacterium]
MVNGVPVKLKGVNHHDSHYLNGEYVGCSSVSHCCSEFKINLKKGENLIEVRVWKWSVQTYLEDQDMFRYNGIFRDVYILKRNKGHVKDIEIGFDNKKIYCDLKYRIFDADNNETDLKNPVLWNAENPYLYTVVVEEAGEYIPFKIGLRDQGISEKGEFLVNGVPVKLKGVNHHDSHYLNGYVMTHEELKNDLILMKKLNINTIRMSHYPPSPEFLELCDEIGFYVVDETDLETHGYIYRNSHESRLIQTTWPCGMPEWKGAFLDRAERMFERDKNHTCIIMWSFGNESFYEKNLEEMGNYFYERDSKVGLRRLRHYEGTSYAPEYMKIDGKDPDVVDVVSRMYSTTEQIDNYFSSGDIRPFFLCEYCHSMGNGPGDMADYWEIIDNNPQFIGGCIWEWADHVYLQDGKPLYGGDWNELAHDMHFCCDGMVTYDRQLKAGSYEIKKVYQPMSAELIGNKIKIYNKYDFTSFERFSFKIVIENDGKEISSKAFKLDTLPHSSDVVEFDIPDAVTKLGMYVTVYMYDEDGYERAFSQLMIKDSSVLLPDEQKADITECGEYAYIKTEDGDYSFNMHYGHLEKVGKLLKTPFDLSIWKAPLDNDRQMKYRFYEENYNKLLN